jgi:hypothetical protein
VQVEAIYRRTASSDPKSTAQALKDSGYTASEVAEALSNLDATQLISIFIEIGFGDQSIVRAARDVIELSFEQLIAIMAANLPDEDLVPRAAVAAAEYGASAEEAAEALDAVGVALSIIMTIVAVIIAGVALAEGLAALAIPQLITVLAVVFSLGAISDRIVEILAEMNVRVDRATAALLAHLPIEETTYAIRQGYDATAETTADALATAGEAWPDIVEAVFDNWGSFETAAGIVPPANVNAADVMAVLFDVFQASIEESNRDKVFWLMKAGMTADNIAKGLRDTIGLDAAAIAQLFVDAGVNSPTAIANALLGGGFTQPLDVAQALKDAGFSLDQVQAALMAAFTLSMQQLGQILSAVFGG